jgi:hypothetical protein
MTLIHPNHAVPRPYIIPKQSTKLNLMSVRGFQKSIGRGIVFVSLFSFDSSYFLQMHVPFPATFCFLLDR